VPGAGKRGRESWMTGIFLSERMIGNLGWEGKR
jgi:hypothetical protein